MNKEFKKTITFGTAKELEEKRKSAFLALTPHERFEQFLLMIQESYLLFGRKKKTPPENFVIERK